MSKFRKRLRLIDEKYLAVLDEKNRPDKVIDKARERIVHVLEEIPSDKIGEYLTVVTNTFASSQKKFNHRIIYLFLLCFLFYYLKDQDAIDFRFLGLRFLDKDLLLAPVPCITAYLLVNTLVVYDYVFLQYKTMQILHKRIYNTGEWATGKLGLPFRFLSHIINLHDKNPPTFKALWWLFLKSYYQFLVILLILIAPSFSVFWMIYWSFIELHDSLLHALMSLSSVVLFIYFLIYFFSSSYLLRALGYKFTVDIKRITMTVYSATRGVISSLLGIQPKH